MATLEVSGKTRSRFIHAAVLLSMLDPVRGEPSTHSLDEDPTKTELTKEQFLKRKFLDAFALICAVRKEGDCVSAACMEEGAPQGTIIRVASNGGVSGGTLEMLRVIIDKLNVIASGVTNRIETEADILLSIIRLDIQRIKHLLSELRHSQKTFKACLGGIEPRILESSTIVAQPHIEQFLGWLSDIATIDPNAKVEVFARCVREAQDARKDYMDVLQAASDTQTGTLPHWISLILKLGRYSVASRALVQLAQDFPSLFIPIAVEALAAPPKVRFVAEDLTLTGVLKRVVPGHEAEYTARLARIWGSNPEARFKSTCPTSLVVHAEVQLACFYDEKRDSRPFRFIGVSKKSCYLCYKFLAFHSGSFNVSSSHQKLYLSWTFPPTVKRQIRARYKSISSEISQAMEGAAQKDLEQRLGTARRPVPADSSAGVSLTGLTEQSAENGFTSGIVGPGRGIKLKRKASVAKNSLEGGARLYPSREDSETAQWSATEFTVPTTTNRVPVSAPISDMVILVTRPGDTLRQDIIRLSDITDQSTQTPSWAKFVDILKAGEKFGLAFNEESEYMVIDGQINIRNERQFLACLQYLRNINRLNVKAAVCSVATS